MSALPKQWFELFHVSVSFTPLLNLRRLPRSSQRQEEKETTFSTDCLVPSCRPSQAKPRSDRPRRSNQTDAKQKPLQLPPQS